MNRKEIEELIVKQTKKKKKLSIFACYYQCKFELNNFTGKNFQYDLEKFLDGIKIGKGVNEIYEYYANILNLKNFNSKLNKLQNINTNGKIKGRDLTIDLITQKILPFFTFTIKKKLDSYFFKGTRASHFPDVRIFNQSKITYLVSKDTKGITFTNEDVNKRTIINTLRCLPHLKIVIFAGIIIITDEILKNLQGVEILDISSTYSSESKTPPISDKGFSYLKRVKELNMNHCNQNTITDEAFSYLQSIKKLSMKYCNQKTITDHAFSYLPELHTLDISYCEQLSSESLRYLKKLNTLNISNNTNIDNTALEYVKGVWELDIGMYESDPEMFNFATGKISDEGFKHIRGIYSLTISNNSEITDKGFKYLKGIHTLKMVNCHQEEIEDEGFKHLKGIKHLNIKRCDQLSIELFKFLKSDVEIEYLNIERTEIKGAEVIKILEYTPGSFLYDEEESDDEESGPETGPDEDE